MMNIPNDIISLKDQGVTDKSLVDLIKLKGAKEEEIITLLNEFYEKKNATQVTEEPLSSASTSTSQFPLLQVIVLVLLILIAGVLGWFIYMQ